MKPGFAKILFFGIILLLTIDTQAQFITTWKTDNPGSSNDDQILIPTQGVGYSYDIYWEEVGNPGNFANEATGVTGDYIITFPSAGTYQVEISGTFPRIFFNSSDDDRKILTVEQWGNIAWTSMASAFEGCVNLRINATDSPDLSGATNLFEMFKGCSSMNDDISGWNVSTITSMRSMFEDATSFNQPLDSWDVSSVENMSSMFDNAEAFNQPLNSWNVSSATNMSQMFRDAEVFNQSLNNWNVSGVTTMEDMFFFARAFNGDIGSWVVSSVSTMDGMFAGALVFNQDITGWDISNVTNMTGMFDGAESFNQNVGLWDISNVNFIARMFSNTKVFNQDITGWDISGITDLGFLFRGAESFNQDISVWDVSGVTQMDGLFSETKVFNADISGWDVSNVIDMRQMFAFSEAFDQDISGWNVSNVRDMDNMFAGPIVLTADITGWDVGMVRSMNGTFQGNPNFNQDISGWNVSLVDDMRQMFSGATSFDQDLGGWDVSALRFAINMFNGSGLSIANYDNLLIGWEAQTLRDNVTFGAQGILFCEGETARESIISTYNWTISDGGLGCITVYEGDDTTGPVILSGQPTAFDFGSTPVGTGKSKNFTIESNLGVDITNLSITTSGSDFSTTPLFFTIAPGNTLTFSILLEGLTIGTFTETVTISADNFSIPFEFDVTGSVTPGPEPEMRVFSSVPFELIPDGSITPYDAGTALKGTDITRTFIIENIGSAELNVLSLFTATTKFSVGNPGPITVPVDATATFDVTLDASVEGFYNDLISLENNDTDESTYTFEIEGFVDGPTIQVRDGSMNTDPIISNGQLIDFGSTNLGDNIFREITIVNAGATQLDVSSISFSGSAFSTDPVPPFSVAANTESNPSITLTFTLNAGSPGTFTETVIINSNDDDIPTFSFDVTGNVSGSTGPEIAVFSGPDTSSPEITDDQIPAVSLGSQTIGNDLDFVFTIENNGGSDLLISNIIVNGAGLSLTGSIPSSVLSGSTEQFTIRLSGASQGIFNGDVTIVSNDADESNFDFPIVGGISPPPAPEIAVYDGSSSNNPEIFSGQDIIDFGITDQGTDIDRVFTIRNIGSSDLSISSIFSSGSAFVIQSSISILSAGAEETFTVSLSGANPGNFSEVLTIQNDDADEGTFTYTLNGVVSVPGNTAPSISNVEDVTIDEDNATNAIPFTVDDAETDPTTLSAMATSDNQALVPDSQISIGGTAPNFTVTVTPLPDQSGTAIITLTVSDGVNTTTEVFVVTVNAVNDIPMITGQIPLSTPKNTPITLQITNFTASDPDNSFPSGFSLIVNDGNNYTVSGTTITPDTDFAGSLSVPVVVNDGADNSPVFDALVTVTETELDLFADGQSKSTGDDIVFPDALVGSSSVEEVTISNGGNIDLIISEIIIEGGDFRLISPIPGPIPPGGSVTLEIEFAPTSIGAKQALMTIVSNAPEQFSVTLSSNGLSEIPEVEVYNAVSTNNDGKNDYFQIRNIEFYPDNQLIIYNRWGSEVFRANNYNNLENTFLGIANNGKRLPDGTYYYILELKSEDEFKQGFLLLSE